MLSRFAFSALLAGLALCARAGVALAADNPDRKEVIIGTALVCLGFIVLVSIAYVAKLMLGLEKQLVQDEDDGPGSAH